MLIDSFRGKYSFLSNFYAPEGGIQVKSKNVLTLEHAYQAAKTVDPEQQARVFACKSSTAAKNAGKKVTLREDWEDIKLGVMAYLLRCKFSPGSNLAEKLLKTGSAILVEGNAWGDEFWGCTNGPQHNTPWQGQNNLGRLLMQVREELRVGNE